MLVLEPGRAFDRPLFVHVVHDPVNFRLGVAQAPERERDGLVDDLDRSAADELLVLDEREVRLDTRRVTVHHEADRAGGREDGDLPVLVAGLLTGFERRVPDRLVGAVELRRQAFGCWNPVSGVAVHPDDFEERISVGRYPPNGPSSEAIFEDWRYASPHISEVIAAE